MAWSGVFLTQDKQNKLRLHYKTLQPRCKKKAIEEDDILKHVILEFEESLEFDNHTAEFSPCRKMCAVFLHFKQKKVMGYILHIMKLYYIFIKFVITDSLIVFLLQGVMAKRFPLKYLFWKPTDCFTSDTQKKESKRK